MVSDNEPIHTSGNMKSRPPPIPASTPASCGHRFHTSLHCSPRAGGGGREGVGGDLSSTPFSGTQRLQPGSWATPGTHTGWEHSCGLQARRMALGFGRASQKLRCTILRSSFRRQPYLVNWDPEDESSRRLNGAVWPLYGVQRGRFTCSFSCSSQLSDGVG